MVNPVLNDLLELDKYREILSDAWFHYNQRLKKLPGMKKFKDSIPHSLEGWISDGDIHDEYIEIEDIESIKHIELLNKIGNNEAFIEDLKDAIRVYYKDYQESKEKIKKELGLMPRIHADEYEENLEDVFSKLDKF